MGIWPIMLKQHLQQQLSFLIIRQTVALEIGLHFCQLLPGDNSFNSTFFEKISNLLANTFVESFSQFLTTNIALVSWCDIVEMLKKIILANSTIMKVLYFLNTLNT